MSFAVTRPVSKTSALALQVAAAKAAYLGRKLEMGAQRCLRTDGGLHNTF